MYPSSILVTFFSKFLYYLFQANLLFFTTPFDSLQCCPQPPAKKQEQIKQKKYPRRESPAGVSLVYAKFGYASVM